MAFKDAIRNAYQEELERRPERAAEIRAALRALDDEEPSVEVIAERKQARAGRRVERATNPPGGRPRVTRSEE